LSFLRASFWLAIAASHSLFLFRPLATGREMSLWTAAALVVTILMAVAESVGRGPISSFGLFRSVRGMIVVVILLMLLHGQAIARTITDDAEFSDVARQAAAMTLIATTCAMMVAGLINDRAGEPRSHRPRMAGQLTALVARVAQTPPRRRLDRWISWRLALAPPR
jgi:hypothetical protein